jgi:hypothetical protein
MDSEPIIYVADAGSASKGNFHWTSSRVVEESTTDPQGLASAVAADLKSGKKVALGYESPLFVPVDTSSSSLGCARNGECEEATGNRPFTAGAGATVLATGIQSLAWVLREIKQLAPTTKASTRWSDFREDTFNLFVWEAFVSGSEKAYPPSHSGDAALAIAAFRQVKSSVENPTRILSANAFSLVGAALVWSGLSTDVTLLAEPCVVIRPIFSMQESKARLAAYKLRQSEAKKAKVRKKNESQRDL